MINKSTTQTNKKPYKLTLGPVLFNWKVNEWRDFYFKMAENPHIDEVYVGEVVCHKRYPFFEVAFNDVINRLEEAGKVVNISSFSLILGKQEINSNKAMLNAFTENKIELDESKPRNFGDNAIKNNHNRLVEVNDVGLLGVLKGKDYIVGPTVNTYNEYTAQTLANQGAKRICFPYEIDKASLEFISKALPNTEKEIFAFGRMPLAIAARCYHARIHGTTKEDCRYVCEKDYNGKPITTTTGEDFLAVNGTQTMSFSFNNLINELQELMAIGVNVFRISPHFMDMDSVINLFKAVLDGVMEPNEAFIKMQTLLPPRSKFANGFFYGTAGRDMMKNSE
jgi:collagenase-like PrtC family protease